nr:hypothetical protein [Candidatus Sigynarchaeota archaeon]
INHAILTGSELWQGFAKLTAAGHIIDQSGRFSLAGVAKATWEKQKRSRINVGAQFDACEALLRVSKPVPDKAMQDTRAWDYPSITDEMVKAATDAYLRDFWATKPSHNR